MAAWIILIGLGVAVAGVLVKVGVDVARYLRADREAHGGRQTVTAAKQAGAVIVLVVVLVALLIVVPLIAGDG
ncbi:MAG: hypothetical protein JHC74_05140 [Thermoleophilia bacterium]|nr:hypothetical protein [Thermoleophilia bacterium]